MAYFIEINKYKEDSKRLFYSVISDIGPTKFFFAIYNQEMIIYSDKYGNNILGRLNLDNPKQIINIENINSKVLALVITKLCKFDKHTVPDDFSIYA